jgi:chromosome segregation ATPase
LAKSAGAATKPQPQPDNRNTNDRKPTDADAANGQDAVQGKSEVAAIVPVDVSPVDASSAVDLSVFAKAREAIDQQMKFWALAIEDTGRSWKQFDDQVSGASSELVRLRETEKDFRQLSVLYGDEKAAAETLRTELADVKTKEAAANDRAAKLEDICEQIKERALEIHTALQTTRASEQKLQGELGGIKSELVELRRIAQEESAGRLAAEERNGKLQTLVGELEAVEAEARERLAKMTQDNKVMAQQVPQLLADCNSWQKQFSASERENTRMQSERRVAAERIADLEAEIKTLRSDLASLVGAQPAKAEDQPVAQAAPQNDGDDFDDTDLVSSLDRAFAAGESKDSPSGSGQPH